MKVTETVDGEGGRGVEVREVEVMKVKVKLLAEVEVVKIMYMI